MFNLSKVYSKFLELIKIFGITRAKYMSSQKIQNRVYVNNMAFKMFVSFLFFFMVPLPMGASVCLEYPVIGTLDCSKENLNSIPYSKVMSWVKNANFAQNNLTAINVTRLLALFPNVMQIDLRYY